MKQMIEKRITELKKSHDETEAQIKNAQEYINQNIPRLNALKGAIAEFELMLSKLDEQHKTVNSAIDKHLEVLEKEEKV